MHAKKGIIRGKNKLDKGKNEAINDITAINPEHMPMKAIFSLVVSFCLKIFIFLFWKKNGLIVPDLRAFFIGINIYIQFESQFFLNIAFPYL